MTDLADAIAAPLEHKIGRRKLLFAPLTISDVAFLTKNSGLGTIDFHRLTLLTWLSLRKWQPDLSWKQVRRLCWFPWRRTAIIRVIASINASHFRPLDKDESADSDVSKTGVDGLFGSLAETFGWTPAQIGSMTWDQAVMFLGTKENPHKKTFSTLKEAREYQKSLRLGDK